MRVLVACEFSGIVRDAFIAAGHDAVSCDLLPTESPGPHIQGDVRDLLDDGWDLMVAHPPCTYLTNAGVRWLYGDYGHKMAPTSLVGEPRWEAMREGAALFHDLLNAPIPRIAVENPIMHKHAEALIGRRQDQVVQPWMFGEPTQKAVALWLVGLPPLIATGPICMERHQLVHKMAPSPTRSHDRSRFFPGIARRDGRSMESVLKRAIPAFILALLLAGTTTGRPPSKGVPVESWTPYPTSGSRERCLRYQSEYNGSYPSNGSQSPCQESAPRGPETAGSPPSPTLRPSGDGATPQGASVSGFAFAASQLDARQFDCLDAIVMHESRWRVDALNRTSGAYGIPQALPASKMASAGADWRTNPVTQVRWMLGYIHGRYDSPCAAWAFWRGHGWY